MTEERFIYFDDGEFCWVADKEECKKTLKDFEQEVIDEGITDKDYIKELAEENYYDYLYDNVMSPDELTTALNRLHQENQSLKQLLKYIRK